MEKHISKDIDKDNKDRYQFQKWYVKLWRRRYYIPIPFRAILFWWAKPWDHKRDWWGFVTAWGVCVGAAQGDMKWYYTWNEVKKLSEHIYKFGSPENAQDGCILIGEYSRKEKIDKFFKGHKENTYKTGKEV